MIVVFLPAIILEIFTTYFTIKVLNFNLMIKPWTICEFSLWNLLLVVPKIVSIYISAKTVNEAQRLSNFIGKYTNYLNDYSTLQQV